MLLIARKKLQLMLQDNNLITKPKDELDKIYTTVLVNSAHHNYNEEEKMYVYKMLREILGSIVCLFSLLSINLLVILISFSREELSQTFKSLHYIPEVLVKLVYPVCLHHSSFRDFILDTQ